MITEKNSTFKKALFAYKIYNLIYLLLAFNAFVNGMTFMKYATMLSAAFGAVLGVWMLKDYKEYLKVPNLWILLAFIISAVISAVVNIKYGFVENIEGLVWMAILLIVIYVPTCNFSREEILKELKVISWITVVYCTAAHVFSLSMIFWGRNMEYKDPQGVGHIVGFNWGRLWGIYDEPNRGSVIGLFAFFLAVYLIWECKKKSTKIFLVLTMVIQYLFLVFSDSRTGQLALAAALFVLAGIGSYNRMHGKGKKKIILAILLACGVAVSSLVLTMGCKAVFNTVDAKIVSMMPAKNEKPKKATKIGRKKDLEKDVSNGRLGIWESGLEIVKVSPVFGASHRNITEFAEDHFPDIYLVNNELKIKYDSMHSMLVDVITAQGIVGFGILILLIGNTLVYLWKRQKNFEKNSYPVSLLLFAVVVMEAAASTVLSTIFYVNSPESFLFWICFAYLMGMAEEKKSGQVCLKAEKEYRKQI